MSWLEDGPGWSPDGGQYWVRDGKAYWHNGDVTDLSKGLWFRTMPFKHTENYSLWSEEERAARWAKTQADNLAYRNEEDRKEAVRRALRKSARAKLTDDEAEACELWDVEDSEVEESNA